MTVNEAAERLLRLHRERKWLIEDDYERAINEALAAERRVGRKQALAECDCHKCEHEWTQMVLDETQ